MNDEADLVYDLQLGIEAEAFWLTDIGRYIKDRCAQEIADGYQELTTVDPFNHEGVRAAQNRVWRADSLLRWLDEAVINGRHAEAELKNLD